MFNENGVTNFNAFKLKMGVRGLGMGPGNRLRCMDIRWDYWDKDWRFRKISVHGTVLLSSCSYIVFQRYS